MLISKILIISVSIIIVSLTFGCGKKIVTVTLQPSDIATKAKGDHDSGDACLSGCLFTMGTACTTNPGPGKALVGYSNSYDPGTQPCPCWEWADCAWRAYVKFDFSPLPSKEVVGANLKWKTRTNIQEGGVATNEGNCAKQIFIAKEPWSPYAISGDPLSGEYFQGNLEIGAIARDWVSGAIENHGLFFVGPNEKLQPKSHDECKTTLSDFMLDVRVAVPK
jgi:hypothetical protein